MMSGIFVIPLRILILLCLAVFRVDVPYLIGRSSHNIKEFLVLVEILELKIGIKFYYYKILGLILRLFPKLSLDLIISTAILLTDVCIGFLLYKISKFTLKDKFSEYRGFWVFTIYLLNPLNILYNHGLNTDNIKYLLLSLLIYLHLSFAEDEKPENGEVSNSGYDLKIFLHDALIVFCLMNLSANYSSLVPALLYQRVYKKIQLTDNSITNLELRHICKLILPSALTIFFALAILRYKLYPFIHEHPFRVLHSHPWIDYSIHWYIKQVLMNAFIRANIFKNHMMVFLFPIPLLIALRKKPTEYLMVMTFINVILQDGLTHVGIMYHIALLSIHYRILERILPFTKLIVILLCTLAFSMFSSQSWINRYMANPNYFFAPQIMIIVLFCLILEDYVKYNYLDIIYQDKISHLIAEAK